MTFDQALALCRSDPEAAARLICDLSARVDAQQRQIDLLLRKADDLERKVAQLSKNSTNSSKPPSSDITRPKPQQRQRGERKIGAQPGHPRHERPAFPEADIKTFHDYRLDACPECGNAEVTFLDEPPRVLQQMEIEKVVVFKEEHRSYPVWCERCQKIHYHPFPEAVAREGLFKERLTALVAYMKSVDHASFSTIRKFVRDVLGESVSRGYLRKVVAKASAALDAPYAELLGRLPLEQAINVDETGHKDNGGKFWTWVFRAELYVLFKIDKTRGSKVLLDVLGEEFDGVLGCDYFSAYHKYMSDFNITVQFCIAHLIRDIKFLTGLPDAETCAYGQRLLAAVKAMFKVIHRRGETDPAAFRRALEQARDRILEEALRDVPSRLDANGKELKREAFNMAKRFRENGKAYFEFVTTPGIGPTNNLAEQAVRFVVIDRRITQGTRGLKGRETCERLWTVVACLPRQGTRRRQGTCAMQGRSAFEFILAAVRAHFRSEPAPSLLPALG
ncbi:MAG: IS66 family transposase [Kiritimatiellae bacterium]|nr:IS66 family transposase [Kiritimatiellia bacterium]